MKNTSNKRVVITGIGAITPIGCTLNEIVQNLKNSKTGVKTISMFDPSALPVRFAGEAAGFKPENFLDAKEIRRNDRFIQMCMAASDLAVKNAGLSSEQLKNSGIAIGVGLGGLSSIEETCFNFQKAGLRKVSPFFVPSILANLASAQISIRHNIKGPNFAVSSACASGSQAIGYAFREIQAGRREIWLAGGAEAPITPLSIAGFHSARALSKQNENPEAASRPFDQQRDGFVIAEGASTLILESLDSALRRNAHIYAEIKGFGIASDGFHITEPDPNGEGAFLAMQECIQDAELSATSIDYVNAHATSTPVGDQIEAVAMERIFQDHSPNLFVSGTKSLTGHACGAAGAIEATFCLLMLKEKFLPPSFNLSTPSPEFKFKAPTQKELNFQPKTIMNNSFGFGGINTSMILTVNDLPT
jgi:3-oxoacyl-[acyl-carrier-protein] synthase II